MNVLLTNMSQFSGVAKVFKVKYNGIVQKCKHPFPFK